MKLFGNCLKRAFQMVMGLKKKKKNLPRWFWVVDLFLIFFFAIFQNV